ncbi:ABC transporter ATP-binding protein [Sinomicrobium soli]|uniref:ABC transporter ATP-binding protein n=1 Tax=Sinomicrobium sp. N-1-3-6 TaxID=2219864 RepID=UPI001F26CB6D|nr:ABC transporter ATP-binding protein [Sinomicrobium sp. N-1-3-6]
MSTNKSDIQVFKDLINAAGAHKSKLRSSLLLMAVSYVFQGLAYAVFYPVFKSIIAKEYEHTMELMWFVAAFFIISTLFSWIANNYDFNGHASEAQYRMRKNLGMQLRRIPMQFLSRRRSGDLAEIISANVEEVTLFVFTVCSVMMMGIVIPVTVGIATLFVDWKLGLAILIIFPAIIPFYRWRKPAFDRGMQYLNDVNNELSTECIEYIQGLPVLKASEGVEKTVEKLGKTVDKVHQVQAYGHGKGGRPNLIITTAVEIGILVILALGILFVVGGSSESIYVIVMMIIVIRFTEVISILVPMTMFFSLMEAGVKKMNALFSVKPLSQPETSAKTESFDIRFEKLSFQYEDSGEYALKNINLHIPEKSIVAFVGPSGSGKTTLTRMVLRYADPTEGSVYIGGQDIRYFKTEDLMDKISVVFQDVYLFDDTIEQNIKMGKPDATPEQVIDAAKRAQCHDFITQLPKGYETKLGEMGNSFSGGEKQRISIARALLKDTPVVILDEPTSSLDSLSELAIQKAIDELVRDKVVLVIAHRLSTIIGANKICVLQESELIEEGTHEELMQQEGKYFQLWQAEEKLAEMV